jgi:hypothetical protein
LVIVSAVASYAQNEESQINISVAMPAQCDLEDNAKTILKNKLLSLATSEGVAATECGAIVMVPSLTVTDEQVIEGGMRNIYTIEMQLSVSVMNILNGTVFSTIQANCKSEGYSKREAERNAMKKLDLTTRTEQMRIAKAKIEDYYQNNTEVIIAKAMTLAQQQAYDEALAYLSSYPESMSGYAQVSTAIATIFKKAQTQYCSQLLQEARSYYANRDFESAAAILSMVDATSSCAQEAKQLQAKIKNDVDAEYNNEQALLQESIKSKERIAKATIKAARDVAVAYYKQQKNYVFFW